MESIPMFDRSNVTYSSNGDTGSPGGSQSVATVIGAILENLQTIVMNRIRETNAMTEIEVLKIGAELQDILNRAVNQSKSLGDKVGALVLDANNERNISQAIGRQTTAVQGFVRDLSRGLDAQRVAADDAAAKSASIIKLGQTVQSVAKSSKILALNARIEAARAGQQGAGFRVIATEMGRLSALIQEANQSIELIASDLERLLPSLAGKAQALMGATHSFREELSHHLECVAVGTEDLQSAVMEITQETEKNLESISSSAYKVLSALQFQDPTAQYLLLSAKDFENAAEEMGRCLDAAHAADAIVPAGTRKELVAAKSNRPAASGEVSLFDSSLTVDAGEVLLF